MSSSDRILVGTRKGLFTLRRGRAGWQVADVAFLGDPVTMVAADPRDGALYAALKTGHFGPKLRRLDAGASEWRELETPRYPEKPADLEDLDPWRKKPVPWSLQLVWELTPGGSPGELWCGTIPGGLFASRDRGESWTMLRTLWDRPERRKWSGGGFDHPGIHSICVDPRVPRTVRLAVSIGGVWTTRDGGETWENTGRGLRAEYMPPEQAFDLDAQDPHRMVQCPGHPDVLWIQHHNGIFRSTDGGASWSEIEDVAPSAFGFAVAVHPTDPDTAWFVPAVKDEVRVPADGRVVVNRTRDGGRTFETLAEGLPGPHAYDLVYRHALDVDPTGERVAFGSTTGSLWISENGGDRFELLNAHLPPIAVVRFG